MTALTVLVVISALCCAALLGTLGLGMFVRPGVRHMTPVDLGTTVILMGLSGAFLYGAWLGLQAVRA